MSSSSNWDRQTLRTKQNFIEKDRSFSSNLIRQSSCFSFSLIKTLLLWEENVDVESMLRIAFNITISRIILSWMNSKKPILFSNDWNWFCWSDLMSSQLTFILTDYFSCKLEPNNRLFCSCKTALVIFVVNRQKAAS